MHALCRTPMLLPGRLLPQAGAMHPVRSHLVVRGRLLPQAATVPPVLLPVMVHGRLLPETPPILLLAGASAILPLPAKVADRPVVPSGKAAPAAEI